jgi:hypothetical protein
MDLSGHTYWPTLNSLTGSSLSAISYRYPYVYCVYRLWRPNNLEDQLTCAQKLDSSGTPQWGATGVVLSHFGSNDFYGSEDLSCAVDDSGGVAMATDWFSHQYIKKIPIKHCKADGSLGGLTTPKHSDRLNLRLSSLGTGARYTLPLAGQVKVELYDLLGRQVAVISDQFQQAGTYAVQVETKNLPSGIYILRLVTAQEVGAVKIAVVH